MTGKSSGLETPTRSPRPPPKTPPPPPPKTAPPLPPKVVEAPILGSAYSNDLLTFDQLPHWQQDNAYILTGYRPASYSIVRSLRSILEVHNESVNIHTHLFGTAIFVILPLWGFSLGAWNDFFSSTPSLVPLTWLFETPGDVLPFLPFLLGAVICLATSSLYHATCNVSPEFARKGNQADYVGIVAMTSGSIISSVYFGFYCWRFWQVFYWGMIIVIGTGCTIVTVNPKFRTPRWRSFRAGMFVMMGCSGIFPVVQAGWMFGFEEMESRIALIQVVSQGLLYILGASLYAARWPECVWPGKFDVIGSSHQIFHVLVVMAAGTHFWGLVKAAEYMRTSDTCPVLAID